MIAWFAKDNDGSEWVFLDDPKWIYKEYREANETPIGQFHWEGTVLLMPGEAIEFSPNLGFPKLEGGQKQRISYQHRDAGRGLGVA